MSGSESALVVIKAAQTAYPLGKAVWKHVRSIRRAAALLSFWEAWRAGLLASYRDREEALADIVQSVSTSTAIRILSNKGDDWLGQHGRLSPTIRQLKGSEKKPLVKTLLMHRAALWITGYAHEYKGKDLALVGEDYAAGHLSVCRFCEELGLPSPRFHKQAAAWRFVMTDDDVFVSTYDVIDHIGAGKSIDIHQSLLFINL